MRDIEDAWFKFILDGGRNPDVLREMSSLHRKRMLLMDHLLVLRHYGAKGVAPDKRILKESKSAVIWADAMDRLRPMFIKLGHVSPKFTPVVVGGTDVQTPASC